jgi:hypothetical protein
MGFRVCSEFVLNPVATMFKIGSKIRDRQDMIRDCAVGA